MSVELCWQMSKDLPWVLCFFRCITAFIEFADDVILHKTWVLVEFNFYLLETKLTKNKAKIQK